MRIQNSKFRNIKFDAGWYKIVAITKDKYGEEVKAEKYFQLIESSPYDPSSRPLNKSINEAIRVDVTKRNVEPGEQINLQHYYWF